jgi:hypothetical protein
MYALAEESVVFDEGARELEAYGVSDVRQVWPRLVREAAPSYAPALEMEPVPDVEPGASTSPEGVAAEPSGAACASVSRTEWEGRETAERSAGETPVDAEADDPADELLLLGERCALAYLQSDALQYRAMKLLAEFHQREGWRDTSFGSTADWLAWRIGIHQGTARERLRTALALEVLPKTSLAMDQGQLSFAKVRALTRAATPQNEEVLLDLAHSCSAAHLERIVRAWKLLDRKSEITAEQIRHRSRRFSAFVDDDGMVVVRGRLDPEVGAVLMRAVEAATDALYRAGHKDTEEDRDPLERWSESDVGEDPKEPTPEQRRADAVGLIAERALGAGFGGDDVVSGSRAERYQVMLHVEEDTLRGDREPGQSELEDGTRVSAETSRRLACDTGLVTITHGREGEVRGASHRKRTVSPSLRRALEARDRGCRFPGCGSRFTEAHHVKHWADGGETSLRNLVLLCRRHHRAVHEGGTTVCIDRDAQVVFFTPKGKVLLGAPAARPVPVGRADLGPEPELFTGTPRYKN